VKRSVHLWIGSLVISEIICAVCSFGQSDVPVVKVDVRSAFVWGQDSIGGAVSSTVRDPLTGGLFPKLTYRGIGLGVRIGYEHVREGQAGIVLEFSATVINNSGAEISARYGGTIIDGKPVGLSMVIADNQVHELARTAESIAVLSSRMYCFMSGFLPGETFATAATSSMTAEISSGTGFTLSYVVRDPRASAVLCSLHGCHPKGEIRSYLLVDGRDYVFVVPGSSIPYCGR
jgi:hypothetical protein